MSLGIRTLWRARAISPAGSLIPREPVASSLLKPLTNNTLTPLRRTWVLAARRLESGSSDTKADAKADTSVTNNRISIHPPTATPALNQATFAERLALIPVRPHEANSVLVRSRIEYPHPRERRLNDHMRHREMKAQKRHEAIAQRYHEPLPNWRRVLQELTAATPRYINGVVRVLVPRVASDTLLNRAAENNLWDIRSWTQCYMVVERERDQDGNAVLKISGTRTAVERTIDHVVEVAKKVKVLLLSQGVETIIHDGIVDGVSSGLPSPSKQIFIGETPSLSDLPKSPELTTTPQDVPKPLSWTKETFEQYVATLTRGYVPVHRAYALYPDRTSHQEAVVKQLVDVFYAPETQESLSSEAFRIALEFIALRGRTFRPQARVLFDRMERVGLPTDATIFNLLIESTIRDRDLRNFSNCVYLMIARGHEPNIKTWLLFLRLIQSEEVRRYILQAMVHKNLLVSPESMAQVAFEMAPYDAERAVRQGLDLEPFLAEQSTLYGRDWLSFPVATPTCNRIIEVMAKHGKWDQVGQFADFMATRPSPYVYPDRYTLRICVEHARVQTYARSAIDLLQRFENYGITPGKGALRSLFMAFWHQNMPHAMDMVWQYALLRGKTSSAMAQRIIDIMNMGFNMGWAAEGDVPKRAYFLRTAKHLKQRALYVLLKTSSKRMFQVQDIMAHVNLMSVLRSRGLRMRSEGYVVPPGALSRALRDAAERDSRFHKGLTQRKWIIEPAILPTKLTGEGAKALPQDLQEDDHDEDPDDEEFDEQEERPEQLEKHQDMEI